MIIGYGYKRRESDLRNAGAERVFIDTQRSRPERADMMMHNQVRSGDTLLVLNRLDIGGTPKATDQFIDRAVKLGVIFQVAPGDWPAGNGRPAKYKFTPEQDAKCRDVQLNEWLTGDGRQERITEIMGHAVPRHILEYRYGTADKPKKQKEDSK